MITGASRGLGLALATELAGRGWALVVDARGQAALQEAATRLSERTAVTAVPGDVGDERHLQALVEAGGRAGGGTIDAIVNNASMLGPSPQPRLADYPLDVLERVYRVNVFAPIRLVQLALPFLAPGTRILNVTSDAGVEGYEGWGGYGSSKAALEQASNVLASEHPDLKVYWVDPGDMNTQMHQDAYPGEDISDRPSPEQSVPGLLRLLEGDLPSGRYRTGELADPVNATRAPFEFELPPDLDVHEPPEARGLARDEVRLMVAHRSDLRLEHARFRDLVRFLEPGDLLVINNSGTLPASLDARRGRAQPLELHLSTPLPSGAEGIDLELDRDRAHGRGSSSSGGFRTAGACRSGPPTRARCSSFRREGEPRSSVRIRRIAGPIPPARASRGSGSPGSRSPSHWDRISGATASRSVTTGGPGVALVLLPDRVRRGAGKRRDAECRTALHPEIRGAHRPRRGHRARHAARRGLLPRGARAPYAEYFRVAEETPAGSPRPSDRRAGRRGRHDRGRGPSRARPAGQAAGGRGMDDLVLGRTGRCAWWTACSPGGTSRGRRIC